MKLTDKNLGLKITLEDNSSPFLKAVNCKVELMSLTRTVGGNIQAEIYLEGVDYVQLLTPGSNRKLVKL